ncbi:flippase [Azospirillum sp.]|uniref:flippase n=1 Tax=Azospirillum sp. TaxID=34012 RepID=UPI002D36071D|nr:flippase [Azospirillum sp.]HYD65229.1 flippase [Azospirillum sp.]
MIAAALRSRLLRNTGWNLLGEGMPLAAAVLSIPLLIQHIGLERFGALTLTWALLGYLTLLDFGMGRALTQRIAELTGQGRDADLPAEVWPPLLLMGALGASAGVAVWLASDWLAHNVVHADGVGGEEIATALRLVALIVPTALLTGGFRGILEGLHRFDLSNAVKVPVGVLNYLSPLFVLPFTESLIAVIAAIALGRAAGMAAYMTLAARVTPGLFAGIGRRGESLRHVLVTGGWMTVSNVVGPVMIYADRFVLASLVPLAAVAYYTTPFELVSRLLFVPAALAGALFPTASADRGRPERLASFVERGGTAVAGVFLPVLLAVPLAGHWGLSLWLGSAFADQAAPVLSVLVLGVFFNAVAYVPFAVIQGMGRADLTAKLHAAEMPLYLGALYLLAGEYGILGAAVAWTLRTGGDLAVILVMAGRLTGRTEAVRTLAVLCGVAAVAYVAVLTMMWR